MVFDCLSVVVYVFEVVVGGCRSFLLLVTTIDLGGGGVLPYLGYMGTCRSTGFGFWPRCPKQGIQLDLPVP